MVGTRGGFLLPLTRHFLQHTQSRNKPKPHKAKPISQKPINISFLINPFHAPIASYTETQLHHHQWQTQKSTTITSTTNNPQHNHNLHQKTHKQKPTNTENPNPNPRILRSKTKITKMRCGFLFMGINLCMYENGGVGSEEERKKEKERRR